MNHLPTISISIGIKKMRALHAFLDKELKGAMDAMEQVEFTEDPGEFLLVAINFELLEQWKQKLYKIGAKETVKLKLSVPQAMAFFSFWRVFFTIIPNYEGTTLNYLIAEIDKAIINLKYTILHGTPQQHTELSTWTGRDGAPLP